MSRSVRKNKSSRNRMSSPALREPSPVVGSMTRSNSSAQSEALGRGPVISASDVVGPALTCSLVGRSLLSIGTGGRRFSRAADVHVSALPDDGADVLVAERPGDVSGDEAVDDLDGGDVA